MEKAEEVDVAHAHALLVEAARGLALPVLLGGARESLGVLARVKCHLLDLLVERKLLQGELCAHARESQLLARELAPLAHEEGELLVGEAREGHMPRG